MTKTDKDRYLGVFSTLATVINALGLGFGLFYIDTNPRLAVWIVVASIVFYACLRLALGILEFKWRPYGPPDQSDDDGRLLKGNAEVNFPDKLVYEADLSGTRLEIDLRRKHNADFIPSSN